MHPRVVAYSRIGASPNPVDYHYRPSLTDGRPDPSLWDQPIEMISSAYPDLSTVYKREDFGGFGWGCHLGSSAGLLQVGDKYVCAFNDIIKDIVQQNGTGDHIPFLYLLLVHEAEEYCLAGECEDKGGGPVTNINNEVVATYMEMNAYVNLDRGSRERVRSICGRLDRNTSDSRYTEALNFYDQFGFGDFLTRETLFKIASYVSTFPGYELKDFDEKRVRGCLEERGFKFNGE